MKHLHMGVNVQNLRTVLQEIGPFKAIIDGDGWNAWGERPGEDVNDYVTLHIIVEVMSDQVGEELAAQVWPFLTVLDKQDPRNVPAGTLAVVTDKDDWSEYVTTLHANTLANRYTNKEA